MDWKTLRQGMGLNLLRMGSLAILLSALAACTGKTSGGTASLTLGLPNFNKSSSLPASMMSTDVSANALSSVTFPSRIMINVQGSGMDPVIYIFESNSLSNPAPTSVTLPPVMRGSGRIVQALVITKTVLVDANNNPIGDGTQTFYYGDQTQDITGDTSVDITLAQVNVAQGAQGAIAGRLIDSDGTGPTGHVSVKYQPQNGRPPMTVTETEMHGGWFSFIAFEGLPFRYFLDSGRELFPNFLLGNVPTSLGQNQAYVRVPSGYRSNWLNGAEVSRQPDPGYKFLLGFFGDGASGKIMCYDSSTSLTVSNFYVNPTVGDTTLFTWAGAAAPSATQAGVVVGGMSSSGAACAGVADYYSTWLKVDTSRLTNGNEVFAFRAPFRVFQNSSSQSVLLDANVDATNTLNLGWAFLPGTTGSGRVTSVGVFTRTLATAPTGYSGNPDYALDGNILCNRLTDPAFLPNGPFTLQGTFPVSATPLAVQKGSVANVSASNFSSGKLQVILCPYSDDNKRYFNAGLDLQGGGSGGGGGGVQTPSYEIRFSTTNTTQGYANVAVNTCTAVTASLFMNNASTTATAAMAVPLSSSTASYSLYADAGCTSAISSLNIAAGTSSTTLYFKASAASFNSVSVMNSNGGSVSWWSQPLTMVAVNAITPSSARLSSNMNTGTGLFASGNCYPIEVVTTDSQGNPSASGGTSATYTLHDNNSTAGIFYGDPACSTLLPSNGVTLAAGQAFARVWFKPNTTSPSSSISASGTPTATSFSYQSASATIASLSMVKNTMGGGSSYYAPGECFPAQVMAYNSIGAIVSPTTSNTVNLTSSSGLAFSTMSDCSNATSSFSTTFPSGTQNGSYMFYVKAASGATGTLTASITLSPTAASGTASFYQQPAQIQVSGPVGGSLMTGFCHTIYVGAYWSGTTQTLSAPISLSVSANGASLFNDPSCSSPLPPGGMITMASGSNSQSILYLRSSSATTVTATPSGMALSAGTLNLTPYTFTVAGGNFSTAGGPYMANNCVPVQVSMPHAPSDTLPMTLTMPMTYNMVAAPNPPYSYFYTDAACTTGNSLTSPSSNISGGSSVNPLTVNMGYVLFANTAFSSQVPSIQVQVGGFTTPLTATLGPATCSASSCN